MHHEPERRGLHVPDLDREVLPSCCRRRLQAEPELVPWRHEAPRDDRRRRVPHRIIIEPAEEGGYVVTCPSLRGVVTEGETLEEARAMAADAIAGYLELLR